MKTWKIPLFILLGLLAVLSVIWLTCFSPLQRSRNFHILETYRFTSAVGAENRLAVHLPISNGYQEIGEVHVKEADSLRWEDRDGYRILIADQKGTGREQTLTLEYTVRLLGGNRTWNLPVPEAYLQPTDLTDSENPEIVATAQSLQVPDDELETARRISAWVSRHIRFDRTEKVNIESPSASATLETGKGVCSDYARLTTAMLRAVGIPARPVSGLVLNKLIKNPGDWMHSAQSGSHAWVEFRTRGQWHFCDPTWGSRYFDRTDAFHLSYGLESDNGSTAFEEESTWFAEPEMITIAAMSAPMRFQAWSKDRNATIVPRVELSQE